MEIDTDFMSEFKGLTREKADFQQKCAKLAHDIITGQVTIVVLVEKLGVLLVDTAPNNRELGTWILTEVLGQLPSNHLDSQQLTFISSFYADRLKDNSQVIPAVLGGILAILKFQNFPEGAATQILLAVFKNVSCQQQQQIDRRKMYEIFQILLEGQTTELRSMGLDFVYGVISAVDGERDPKSLVFLFNWLPKFLKTVELKHLVESAFEILDCYFPIDFKAPPQDENGITREKLADSLAPCLCAIPEFAELCLPLALEKLESSLEIAKLDSLQLLTLGCSTFHTSSYVQHCTEIWTQIQRELFNNPNCELESACVKALSAVMHKISEDPSADTTLKDIADTVKGNLFPESKLYAASARLLITVSVSSRKASDIITKEIAPILINSTNITTIPAQRVKVLNSLVTFFEGYIHLHDSIEFEDLQTVPVICLKTSMEDNASLRTAGFDGLQKLSQFLPKDVREALFSNLRVVLLVAQPNEVRQAALKLLEKLARDYPIEIKEKFIDEIQIVDSYSLELFLESVSVLVLHDYFRDCVLEIVISYLSDQEKGVIALKTLKTILKQHELDAKIQTYLFEANVVGSVVNFVVNSGDKVEMECLENCTFILKSIIGYQDSNNQTAIINSEIPKTANLLQGKQVRTWVFILDGLLIRLRKDVKINYNLLNDLINVTLHEDAELQSVAMPLLANLLNKCGYEAIVEHFLNNFENNFQENQDFITLLAWITKALSMRNHQRAQTFTDKLVALLKTYPSTAMTFRIIMNDNIDSLSARSYCTKSLLYRQKFFNSVSDQLCQQYTSEYPAYLVAVGYLLEHAPKAAILLQFKKILVMVILCLEKCTEPDVLLVLLKTLQEFIEQRESCVEDHIDEFFSRILKLSTFDRSMNVRLLALRCLQLIPVNIPLYKILPRKMETLLVLGTCIDDRKRIVRKEAVFARSIWFLLDAPV